MLFLPTDRKEHVFQAMISLRRNKIDPSQQGEL